jgi:CheY-like chemotaxis protein
MNDKYKILIADDSESSLKMISEILDIVGNGFELYYARNGKEACEKAVTIIPDLILIDVIMPEMNGLEAVQYLRANTITEDIPIIVLSAMDNLDKAYEVGANDFISKPYHEYELLIKVRSAISLVHKIKEIKSQKAELEKKHKEIIDDIIYSKRIQKAIFPTDEYMISLLPQHFILNLPKNIVSGDFYWGCELEDKKIIAVADCTGHEISGAFMTMAGTAFLSEIINKNKVHQANEILFELRKLVMNQLKHKGEEGEASDGMDISLNIIDNKHKVIQFAGANSALFFIRNNAVTIYKGDKMPIGIHMLFDKPFKNHEIEIQTGDMIYLFTDGYADQFGGPRNKKFRYQQFQDLLLKIHNMPLYKQKETLLRTMTDWKGDNIQIDDILILGYRI